jgi:dihydroorotase
MDCIIASKKKGTNLTCEVTPHHIGLTDEVKYKVNPPIRTRSDVSFLINAIKEGWVDAIGTDHAPHSHEDKKNGSPGISGIETSFSVCYTKLVKEGHINLNKLSEIMSKNPGRIMGLNKGKIQIGYDGDLVLVDINKSVMVDADKFQSKGKNTPFDGMKLYGEVKMTIKGGKVVYSGEE